jgi:hypothetical protein
MSTRGFKELAGVSHLGPALATLVQLHTRYQDKSWHAEAERLLTGVENTRAANSVELWRDTIAVEAYQGREQSIADMVDYSCPVTARYLRRALADEQYLTARTLREDYLAGGGETELPVPINDLMIATFFLTGMDVSFRIIRWFRIQDIDWNRAMVLIAGQQGRPTAGVTWNTSSVALVQHPRHRRALPNHVRGPPALRPRPGRQPRRQRPHGHRDQRDAAHPRPRRHARHGHSLAHGAGRPAPAALRMRHRLRGEPASRRR